MHLYLRNGEFSTEVPEIQLRDGCYPSLGHVQVVPNQNNFSGTSSGDLESYVEDIEPAVWFKVLVLDSISVDCQRRAILWNSVSDGLSYEESQTVPPSVNTNVNNRNGDSSPEIPGRRQRIAESMYIGGECYGYHSDLDEVFDKTDQLLKDYVSGKVSRRQFHDVVMRLLHCYILPSIHLTTDDTGKVAEALQMQELAIEKVDSDILAKNDRIDDVRSAIKRQQDQYVTQILQETTVPEYPHNFVQALFKDISKSVEKSWEEIECLQNSVEELKRRSQSSDEVESSTDSSEPDQTDTVVDKMLSERRKQRDSYFENYHSLLVVRETLKETYECLSPQEPKKSSKRSKGGKSSSKKKPNGVASPMCDVYVGMHDTINDINKDAKKLTDKKLLIISVKEALRSTLNELISGEDSYGVDVDKTGLKKSTDVLRHTSVPKEWQTLTEQVASILLDQNHAISQQHVAFCNQLVRKCDAAVFERQLLDAAVSASKHISNVEESVEINQRSGSISVENKLYHLQRQRASATSSSDSGVMVTSTDHGESARTVRCLNDGIKSRPSDLENACELQEMVSNQSTSRPVSENSVGSLCLSEAASEDLISQRSLHFDNLRLTLDPNAKPKVKGSGCLPFARLSIRSDNATDTLPYDNATPESHSKTISLTETNDDLDAASHASDASYRLYQENSELVDGDKLVSLSADLNLDTSDDLVIIYDTERNYIRKSIDLIKNDIQKHFDCITKSFQLVLNNHDAAYYRKIWLAYENHFYALVTEHVIKLYEVEYADVTLTLSEMISVLTIEDLELSESPIIHMLQVAPSTRQSKRTHMNQNATWCQGTESYAKATKCKCLNTISEGEEISGSDSSLSPLYIRHSSDKSSPGEKTGSFGRFLRHFSAPVHSGSENPPRTITVYHPTSITVIYDRRTWPLPHKNMLLDDTAEPGLEATALNDNVFPSSNDIMNEPGCSSDSYHADENQVVCSENVPKGALRMKPKYRERFAKTFVCIEGALKETAPLLKLQHLTSCLRELSLQLSYFQEELYKESLPPCSDDLIDVLVMLLCNCDSHQVGLLYAHIMMLSDVMAPFFAGGPFSFSLVQFSVAYQFIQDRLVMKKRLDNAKESTV